MMGEKPESGKETSISLLLYTKKDIFYFNVFSI